MAEIKIKPKIEDIASDYIDGDVLNNLLNFTAWMRANRMTPTFANASKEGVNYTSRICYLKLRHGSWHIWPAGKKDGYLHEYARKFLTCEALKNWYPRSYDKLCSFGLMFAIYIVYWNDKILSPKIYRNVDRF